MPTPDQDALGWLQTFEAACRTKDFDAGRVMFAQDAVAFGTWAMAVHGLDNIEREQWRNVWPRIRGFAFEPKPVVRTNGRPFTRTGRATFVLNHRDGRWQCVHSHVSLQPTQSESAHGRLGA